jgi:hypothetical protein
VGIFYHGHDKKWNSRALSRNGFLYAVRYADMICKDSVKIRWAPLGPGRSERSKGL